MTITPQGTIHLCRTPLINDYKNQVNFSNSTTQLNYFNGTVKQNFSEYTYIKKDNVVKVGINIDSIIDCNYLFYRNNGFTNKVFYCFITNMEYVNENCTAITFETDVFQTWQFDINYNRCFVEREHTNDDTVGANTVPENLETGEYVIDQILYDSGLDDLRYIIQCTEWSTSNDKPLATNYGGVYAAGGAYICENINQVVNILQAFATSGRSEAVYSVYMCPASVINNTSSSLQYSGQSSPIYRDYYVDKPTSLNGYTPINKKLLTFPYCALNISNNNGSTNTLQYELFNTDQSFGNRCGFHIKGVPTPGASVKLCPYNYKNSGENDNEDEGLLAGKFPTLSWSEDAYTNWLTQNSVNIGLGVTSSLITIVGGVGMMATGGGVLAGASTVVSGGMGIANTLGQVYQHSLTPNSCKGNTNGGDINVSSHKNGFFFNKLSIKTEYARIIDNYFSMFGYKTNRVKIPNITGRQNWNYVKTIDCTFSGNIPQIDMNIIRNMFNQGTTIWHSPNAMYNYSLSNNIV